MRSGAAKVVKVKMEGETGRAYCSFGVDVQYLAN